MDIKQLYSYRVKWKRFHNDNSIIDDMWDWADENIGPKNFTYRDLSFHFVNESDLTMFTLRWSQQ